MAYLEDPSDPFSKTKNKIAKISTFDTLNFIGVVPQLAALPW